MSAGLRNSDLLSAPLHMSLFRALFVAWFRPCASANVKGRTTEDPLRDHAVTVRYPDAAVTLAGWRRPRIPGPGARPVQAFAANRANHRFANAFACDGRTGVSDSSDPSRRYGDRPPPRRCRDHESRVDAAGRLT